MAIHLILYNCTLVRTNFCVFCVFVLGGLLAKKCHIYDSSKWELGGSYGGYMTVAALCFHPDEFKTGVDLFRVVNWPRTLKEIPPYWESFVVSAKRVKNPFPYIC